MNWAADCVVIIPCLNEEQAVGAVVAGALRHLPNVVVVDDGSIDQTGEKAAAAGARVIRHSEPCGKGAALASGWRWAHAKGFRWALMLDGDGQHDPADAPRFLELAESTDALMVVGNRMTNPAPMPWLRRQVNRWMSRMLSRLAGQSLPDSQCGFRLMNLDAWSRLNITARHFEIESEMLVAFAVAGHRIGFVPISPCYRGEHSKINPLRDTLRWWRWWRSAKSEFVAPAISAEKPLVEFALRESDRA